MIKDLPEKELEELRLAYESGENTFSLAVRFNLNQGSLKNYASKNKWKHGIRKKLIKDTCNILDAEAISKEIEEIKIKFKGLMLGTLNDIGDSDGTIKSQQEALLARMRALREGYQLAVSLLDIKTTAEEIEHKKNMLTYKALVSKMELEITKYEEEIKSIKHKRTIDRKKTKIEEHKAGLTGNSEDYVYG